MDKTEYQQLASEFIDMWQKQLETVVTDKQFVQSMFAGLQQMTNYATPKSHEQTTSATSDAVLEQLNELDFRLRMVEKRIEKLELESKPKKRDGSPTRSSAKRSTKKVSKPTKRGK